MRWHEHRDMTFDIPNCEPVALLRPAQRVDRSIERFRQADRLTGEIVNHDLAGRVSHRDALLIRADSHSSPLHAAKAQSLARWHRRIRGIPIAPIEKNRGLVRRQRHKRAAWRNGYSMLYRIDRDVPVGRLHPDFVRSSPIEANGPLIEHDNHPIDVEWREGADRRGVSFLSALYHRQIPACGIFGLRIQIKRAHPARSDRKIQLGSAGPADRLGDVGSKGDDAGGMR